MNEKIDLKPMENIKSPASLDETVLQHAHNKVAPSKYSFTRLATAVTAAYCFGLLSFSALESNKPVITDPHLEISLKPLIFRNSNVEKTKVVDVSTLTNAQRRELTIELLMRDDLDQAQKLLNWMDENKNK